MTPADSMGPIDPCCFCGVEESPFLFTVALCPSCAKVSRVSFVTHEGHIGNAIVHQDGRWRWLSWSSGDTLRLRQSFEDELPARMTRHVLIATSRASLEDPEFLAHIGDYVAQVGWTPTIERALRRQREAGETAGALAEAQRILGLRPTD